MFDGTESPCTQTFGLGLFEDTTDAHLREIERFFVEREAPVFHEVSPMAGQTLLGLLNERGYRPIEMSSVMYREIRTPVEPLPSEDREISTRIIDDEEVDLWAATSAAGWATEHESLADFMFGFGQITAQCNGSYPYIAEVSGQPIATGMMFVFGDVAVLAGASTIPNGRNKGAQNALLDARLRFAAENGCKLAMMSTLPGSQSQRNAQKNGFAVAYTRTKWQLVPD